MKINIEFRTSGTPQTKSVIKEMQGIPRIGDFVCSNDNDSIVGQVTSVIWMSNGKPVIKVLL